MKYIRQSMTFFIQEPTVLSLGKFDGLHRGHELLLEYMAEKKQQQKELKSVVFTFDIPPREEVHHVSALLNVPLRRKSCVWKRKNLSV